MPKYDKNETKALFKQIITFKKNIDAEKAKKDTYYRKQVCNIISGLRSLINDNIRIDPMNNCYQWGREYGKTIALGSLKFYGYYEVSRYWPESVKKALKENDHTLLKAKKLYYYKNNRYYGKSEYFEDKSGKLWERAKYYEGAESVAYSKEKYIFATNSGRFFIKKQSRKPKYEKKIPNISSVTLEINRWSNCTKEFVWSMFEYDGKALPDLGRDRYGFLFRNIRKLKFKPTKEHLEILKTINQNGCEDDGSIKISFFKKEKNHKKAVDFLQKICFSGKRVKLTNFQEKLDALGKVADLEEAKNELPSF